MPEALVIPVAPEAEESGELAVRLDCPKPPSEAPFSVLYLHGFGSSKDGEKAEFFRSSFLERGIPVCSFDFRGHGKSGGSMRDLTISRCLEDTRVARRFLENRGAQRVLLFGSSMGGMVGLWHAALHPQGLAAGVHLAPAVGLLESMHDWIGAEGMRRWQREGVHRVEHELGSWDLGWAFVEDLQMYEPRRLAERTSVPALLLQGKQDDSVPWNHVVDFATRCEGTSVELHLFGDGDHRMLDRRGRLWQLIAEFLAGRGFLQDEEGGSHAET